MTVEILMKAEALAKTRKMRVSKAAVRLGLDPQQAKACSVASEVAFVDDEEGMVRAAATIAHSCMTHAADAYRYWARAETDRAEGPVIRPVAVAVYRNSRCLVRLDRREFVKCYGEQAGDLHRALVFLGFRWNEKALNDLWIPRVIQIGVEREPFRTNRFVLVTDNTNPENIWRRAMGLRPILTLETDHRKVTVFENRYRVFAPQPYSDGFRRYLRED